MVDCDPAHLDFRDPGPVARSCLLFSHNAVRVERPVHGEYVADAGCATFYNRGESVQRLDLDGRGDRHAWFAFEDDVAVSTVAPFRPEALSNPQAPFSAPIGPQDPSAFLAQHLLVSRLQCGDAVEPLEPLEVEEFAVSLLARASQRAEAAEAPREQVSERLREMTEYAKQRHARHFSDPCSLAELAREIGCSHAHLARTFRRCAGQTMHQYRAHRRLAQAVVELLGGACDLTALALRLGYSSHSHFTLAFRKLYAATPSDVRSADLVAARALLETERASSS